MESRQDVFYLLTVFHNENCLLLGNLGRKKIEFVMDCFGFSIKVGFHYSSKQHYPIESKDVFHFILFFFNLVFLRYVWKAWSIFWCCFCIGHVFCSKVQTCIFLFDLLWKSPK